MDCLNLEIFSLLRTSSNEKRMPANVVNSMQPCSKEATHRLYARKNWPNNEPRIMRRVLIILMHMHNVHASQVYYFVSHSGKFVLKGTHELRKIVVE